uniref:Ig-like domain-containing protein n=1 Tax=Sinocyclocheilus rhinocerous TaxID=307959 RepID=A0A673HFH2_9TELE
MWTPKSHSTGDSRSTDGTDIHGYFGKGATITCSYSWASTNIKYFCRDPCNDIKDILVKSDQSPTGRYTLKDSGKGTFTVNITDLQESDSGIYWCGVERSGFDSYQKVRLRTPNSQEYFKHTCPILSTIYLVLFKSTAIFFFLKSMHL